VTLGLWRKCVDGRKVKERRWMLLKFGGDRAKEAEIGTTSGDLASGLFRTIQHLLSGMRQSLLPSQPSDWQKFFELHVLHSLILSCI
jgi:hypothetical protein